MGKNFQAIRINFQGKGRRETIDGIMYAVYPVVLLKEGVHHGVFGGPTYYPANVLSQTADRWNDMPIPVYHPKDDDGNYFLFSERPDSINDWSVGSVIEPRFDADKVTATARINILKAAEKHPNLLVKIDAGEKTDVSAGFLGVGDNTSGEWNGEKYTSSITDIIPDHVAILPGMKGACSWDDGCGIRINQMAINKMSFGDVEPSIHDCLSKMDKADGGSWLQSHYLREVFDEYFIYKKVDSEGRTGGLYMQSYSIDDNGRVVLVGEAVPVKEEKKYVPIVNNSNNDKRRLEMKEEGKCCPDKIKALLLKENSAFTEKDAAWLETQTEAVIDKLLSMAEAKEHASKADATEANGPVTLESYLNSAPPEIRVVLDHGIREFNNKVGSLIGVILSHPRNVFDEKTLRGLDISKLESIASIASEPKAENQSEPAFYYGAGGGPFMNSDHKEEAYVPATLCAGKSN